MWENDSKKKRSKSAFICLFPTVKTSSCSIKIPLVTSCMEMLCHPGFRHPWLYQLGAENSLDFNSTWQNQITSPAPSALAISVFSQLNLELQLNLLCYLEWSENRYIFETMGHLNQFHSSFQSEGEKACRQIEGQLRGPVFYVG